MSPGTIFASCGIFMSLYAARTLLVLSLPFFLVLLPAAVIGWSLAVLRHLWFRQWTSALISSAFPAFIALAIVSPGTFARPMIGLVHKVEFLTMRSAYDAKVATAPNTGTPRLIKVSDRDTSAWCCGTQTFEEIWFDESDTLGNPDRKVTDRFLSLSDPSGASSYSIDPLGDHYYLVSRWY